MNCLATTQNASKDQTFQIRLSQPQLPLRRIHTNSNLMFGSDMNAWKMLPDDRLLTAKEIYTAMHLSKSTFYKNLNGGLFPKPFKLGTRTNRWPKSAWSEFFPGSGSEPADIH